MFTGIIEAVGTVIRASEGEFLVEAPTLAGDCTAGESVAINGVDLTVFGVTSTTFTAHVMPETYRCSNLGLVEPGRKVNLERSLRAADRLSGHIVRGVVEGTGSVSSVKREAEALLVQIECPAPLLRHMVLKGPVAVDGVSLTTINVRNTGFGLSLVQFTQNHTTLSLLERGSLVNIETDILARYVERILMGLSESP